MQEQSSRTCCQRCQEDAECHAFESYGTDGGKTCWLYQMFEKYEGYHANWKYQNATRSDMGGSVWSYGSTVSELEIFGDTQDERDARCAAQCELDEHCDIWMQRTTSRTCYLQSAAENSDWIWHIVRGVANLILEEQIEKKLQLVMDTACDNGDVSAFLDAVRDVNDFTILGLGEAVLKVAKDFWDSEESTLISRSKAAWNALKVDATTDFGQLHARNSGLELYTQKMKAAVDASFQQDTVAQHVGSEWAFFLGSVFKACIENGDKCPQPIPTAP